MDERSTALALPDEQNFRRDISAINQFQTIVRNNLKDGHDFGIIPGTQKPTLLKPGAEKIAKLLGLADLYVILDKAEDWEKGFFRYLIKCSLVSVNSNVTISEGLGECNSMEAKYRWRESKRKCPDCGTEAIIKGKDEYGGGWICFKKQGGCGCKFGDNDTSITEQSVGKVANDDIYTQVNTILKMAKKRALVDAALSAGRLSDLFTQDMEDIISEPVPTTKPSEGATSPTVARKPIPEGIFAGGGTEPTKKAIPQTPKEKQGQTMEPMASDRQINALMKLTHSENEVDLLTKAEVFLECPVECLKNITMEDASNWISKLNEGKK